MRSLRTSRFTTSHARRLAIVAACLAAFPGGTESASAGDPCNCEQNRNPVLAAFDSLAGGFNKLLGVSKSSGAACDEMGCEDGCDAMLAQELMSMPYEPHMHSGHDHSAHTPHHHHQAPLPPTAEPMMRMGEPQMAPLPTPSQETHQLPPMRDIRQAPTGSGVRPPERAPDGSIFDALQDPFRDDSTRVNRKPIKATPATYRSSSSRAHKSR